MSFPSQIAELYKHLLLNDQTSGQTTHVLEWLLHTSGAELAIFSINLRTLMSGAKIFAIDVELYNPKWTRFSWYDPKCRELHP